jgi:hypothetical protein
MAMRGEVRGLERLSQATNGYCDKWNRPAKKITEATFSIFGYSEILRPCLYGEKKN